MCQKFRVWAANLEMFVLEDIFNKRRIGRILEVYLRGLALFRCGSATTFTA
jgi:hypothetical protein